MSIPDSSITGIKPIVSSIPSEDVKREKQERERLCDKVLSSTIQSRWKRCCIFGGQPTKIATYRIQGAVRIERCCDRCAEREFSRL
jgi:hypothetical protein